jgi:hypothetical protein
MTKKLADRHPGKTALAPIATLSVLGLQRAVANNGHHNKQSFRDLAAVRVHLRQKENVPMRSLRQSAAFNPNLTFRRISIVGTIRQASDLLQ